MLLKKHLLKLLEVLDYGALILSIAVDKNLVFDLNLIFFILRHTPGPNIFTFYLLFTLALLRNSGDSFQVNFSQLTLNL